MPDAETVAVAKTVYGKLLSVSNTLTLPITVEKRYLPLKKRDDMGNKNYVTVLPSRTERNASARIKKMERIGIEVALRRALEDPYDDEFIERLLYLSEQIKERLEVSLSPTVNVTWLTTEDGGGIYNREMLADQSVFLDVNTFFYLGHK